MRLPYTPVEFTKNGDPADPTQFDAAINMIRGGTDVLMVAHGWNNDIATAEQLFTSLTDNIDILMSGRPTGRSLTVVGLLWPSKQWASDPGDIAGGGAGLGDDLTDLIARIGMVVDDPATRQTLQDLAPKLETDGDAQERFLGALRGLLPQPDAVSDDDALPGDLLTGTVPEVVAAVQDAKADTANPIGTGQTPAGGPDLPPGFVADPLAAGGTAGAGFHFPKINPLQAFNDVLNVTTYYTMKDRAGNVGSRGVAALIDAVASANTGARVHLAGHSFGARVVSAATATTNRPLSSVSLLQGAYSHRGLAAADPSIEMPEGAFRRALTGGFLRGPMVVTWTHNDKAVGLAYAIASRLARQVAAGIGDAGDPYGGIGANGAVGTAEAIAGTLGDQNTTYAFQSGRVHNLHADNFVHSHGDVTNPAVANAVLAAITTVGP